jgi:HEAT repeat protein
MKAPFPTTEELIRVLESDAAVQSKALACQQLAVTGSPEAMPALAVLLMDKQLTDYARSALQVMGGPAAAGVLRKALPDLTGGALSGVIDSLGILRACRRRARA